MSLVKGLSLSRVVDPNDNLWMLSSEDTMQFHNLGVTRIRIEFSLGTSSVWTPALLDLYKRGCEWLTDQKIEIHALYEYQGPPLRMDSSRSLVKACNTYAEVYGKLAEAFPNVAVISIANEPNTIGGTGYLSPAAYAQLFQSAYHAIRKYSSSPISMGGLFAHDQAIWKGANRANSGADYLEQVLTILDKARSSIRVTPDAVEIHPYIGPGGAFDTNVFETYIGYWRSVTGLDIHVSELGWESPHPLTFEMHAANVTSAYAKAMELDLKSLLYFTQYDTAFSKPPLYYGLSGEEGDLEHKLAFFSLKAVVV